MKKHLASVPECNIEGSQAEITISQCEQLDETAINSLDPDVIAELMASIFVNTGADAFDVHPEWKVDGEVAIG
jgi:hypothetical protein